LIADPTNPTNRFRLVFAQYPISLYVRGDNTPENAKYLGYVDAHDLYPDFEYTSFDSFVDDLIAGKIKRPYSNMGV
jgi:hypothetical protein